ncbi:hypothetical protein N1937_13090 [Rhizobium sp. WSM4643]|uniref:hypothetical protein n=1 Tax=Rhizobium sp. WSM4643 TaxID=3138253 RepID=UPI0021A5D357|nr:hypothetical protein [Rhizobium leguminosarum]UWM73671.1 hypothetical protein N1937_13090 [Rhizobium leguminosarum bv. viciae]
MKVEILHKGIVIGHGNLEAADPPMGVAAGLFEATPDYDPRLHPYVIDGDDNEFDKEAPLSARSAEFGMIQCAGVCIEDFHKTMEEIQVVFLGIAYPDYGTVFASSPAYKAYYGR